MLAYIDFRVSLLEGDIAGYTCLLGTTVQEVHGTHPALCAACDRELERHIAQLARDVTAAKRKSAPRANWTPESVGYFMQSVIQGAFIVAKARQSPDVAEACLAHLRRYLETLFGQPPTRKPKEKTQ